jgi:hypothetical protein
LSFPSTWYASNTKFLTGSSQALDERIHERKRAQEFGVGFEMSGGWRKFLRGAHVVVLINDNSIHVNKFRMNPKRPAAVVRQARERIARIKKAIAAIDYLSSGTILQRTKKCCRASCACATDPSARHGPYFG